MAIDSGKAELLARFSKAFNSNDIENAKACVTENFKWIYYEGTEAPYGQIFEGVEAACAAVVARSNRLKSDIEFNEAEEYQAGEKVFTLYRASGEFVDTGFFDVRAIDVYSFNGGHLDCKDTYWKIIR